jgi:uncharacterized membrane protein YeaQ/YmgE (transglycosylase-associated protein family)
MLLGIIGWFLCGFVLGLITSKFVSARSDDPRIGIFSAAAGGVVGGAIYSLLTGSPVMAYNPTSLLCAAVMAVLVLTAWHVYRLRAPYAAQSRRRSY